MLKPSVRSYFWIILLCYYLGRVTCQPRSIILLAGQSNMAGRGGVVDDRWDGIIPPKNGPTRSIYRYTASEKWVVALDPLHKDIDRNHTCGVGPGMTMAHEIVRKAAHGVGPVGLVPCAVGGTNISQWGRGSKLYNMLMRRARSSLREGGTIEGLVWFQGESDTRVKQDADVYKTKLLQFFVDFRTDLQSPMLPIIQVAITSGEGQFIEEVRQAQIGVDLLNLQTVDARGLPLEPDNLHLTTPAQVQLGEKLARAFLQFLPGQEQSNSGSLLVQSVAPNKLRKNCLYTTSLVALSSILIPLL